ncbi:cortical actin cytoskeleton protein asp1 [Verticillium alfalfae VaMs.102]|uniref:Inositol hexakisphosphate and diphosphoinositol-pentakisphosphate kinase n=1 Tax=Verticillium alfalfae (strain VaMs.102 / ATCC MYA-4576 / FGSC 10136) TaxID=526221 RepID=C9SUM6_VERA1|nr:cortical actin cytoskeleton protein asp1 [Verticillium alfalfae VaMs.102]EEY22136.1 cortical actin cytoskeleton protein asp1 [Verticillium alfalfae VaMs.102]
MDQQAPCTGRAVNNSSSLSQLQTTSTPASPPRTLSTLSSSLTTSSSVLTSASSTTLASSAGAPSTSSTSTTPTPTPAATTPVQRPRDRSKRSASLSHTLSSFASGTATALSRKSRHAEPGTTDAHADPASLSMPPPPPPSQASGAASSNPLRSPRSSLCRSRRDSNKSVEAGIDSESFASDIVQKSPNPDLDVTRSGLGISSSTSTFQPDRPLTTRSSFTDSDIKRASISSVYSLASARGVAPSSAASAAGSETGAAPRSVSGIMSSGKPVAGSVPPNPELSNVTVMTSSTNQHLAPRETLDVMKRTPAPVRTDSTIRSQPTRSRSRAKRRFSGSTAASSHSPSSDRGPYHKEREEGQSDISSYQRVSAASNPPPAKPAPWGVIGICALDVKARSKPSRNILNRLIANREFDVVVFGDKVILDEDFENWPMCDYLISFYSDGFPLDKAISYVKARKPFCVNDLPMQKLLWDRRLCLHLLDSIGVPTPKRLEVNRDGGPSMLTPDIAKYIKDVSGVDFDPDEPRWRCAPHKVELLDDDDILSVDGALLKKPFVEKPVSGEDHNIIIYFPKSSGGGARRLFRKIGNKSSEYDPELNVPRAILEPENSYLYEKFMRVENAEDVKAYTVGPNYCHAETRKSPVVDGVVRRNNHGKEVRYVTALNPEEREIASKISTSFGQRVCGFDFLRADDKSYVIDVNGWSFVKDNDDYYEQSAKILKDLFVKERLRRGGVTPPMPSPAVSDVIDPLALRGKEKENGQASVPALPMTKSTGQLPAKTAATSGAMSLGSSPSSLPPPPPLVETGPGSVPSATPSALASAAASLKGDTAPEPEEAPAPPPPPPPKHSWKLKGIVSVIRHADRTPKQKYKFTFHTAPFIELLKGHQEEVLLIGEAALASVIHAVDVAVTQGIEDPNKLKSLRNALVKKGGWAGTKVQIKPMFRKKVTDEVVPPEEVAQILKEGVEAKFPEKADESQSKTDPATRTTPKRHDSLSGVTMSRITAAEESLVLDKLQLIVKWGGEPTHSARYQAQELGENMRNDFMLLNRDVLDEVHVYSSSERRVTTSAQIWTSSFLGRKDLPDDFITIRKDLLDDSNAAKDEMDKVKKKLKGLLRKGNERPSQFAWPDKMPEPSEVQTRVVQLMNFHRRVMQHNFGKLYSGAVNSLNAISNPSIDKSQPGESSAGSMSSALSQANGINNIQARWCCGEDAELFRERWEKLFQEFCDGEKVDPSKISELYDTMKFDALHNRQFLEWVFTPPKQMLEEEYGYQGQQRQQREQLQRRQYQGGQGGQICWQGIGRSKISQTRERKDGIYRDNSTRPPKEYKLEFKKLEIGLLTSLPLLKEIVQDLEEMQASNDAKSFFYFTKESHIYTLLNTILEGGLETKIKRSTIPELDYLSQICFELYESETKVPADVATRGDEATFAYSIRITISPGCHVYDPLDVQLDSKHSISCAPRRSLTLHADWMEVIRTLRAKFNQVKLPKTFLAINLSDLFSYDEQEKKDVDSDGLEMKSLARQSAPKNVPGEAGDVSGLSDITAGDVLESSTELAMTPNAGHGQPSEPSL